MKNPVKFETDYAIIYVTKRDGSVHEVLVDIDDLPRLSSYTVGLTNKGYARISNGRKTEQLLHRFILDVSTDFLVDHEGFNKLDNRKSKLRPCTNTENLHNRQSTGGVYFDFDKQLWRARLAEKHIGYFRIKDDADKAVTDYKATTRPFSKEARESTV